MEFERYSATLRLRGRRFPPHFLAGGSAAKMHGPEFVLFVLLAERNVLWGWAGGRRKKQTNNIEHIVLGNLLSGAHCTTLILSGTLSR